MATFSPYTNDLLKAPLASPTFTGTITSPISVLPIIKPAADSTTAIGIFKADGTTNIFNVDSTNKRIGIGISAPVSVLQVNAATDKNWAMRLDTDVSLEAINDGRSVWVAGRINANPLIINTNSGGKVGIGNGIVAANITGLFHVIAVDAANLVTAIFDQQDTASANAVNILSASTGNALFVDINANGLVNIDKDCTVNDTRTWAAKIDSDNAGTGTALGCGIDMSSFSVDEPLFKVVADAGNTPGTLTGQIAIDVAGTTYYVYYYTTSTVV